jgi:hypothetical protein
VLYFILIFWIKDANYIGDVTSSMNTRPADASLTRETDMGPKGLEAPCLLAFHGD